MESLANGQMRPARYFPIMTGDIRSGLQYGLTERSELHHCHCLYCRAWGLATIQAPKPFTQPQYSACHGFSSPMFMTPDVEVSACSSLSYNEYAKPKKEKKTRQNRPQCSICDKTFARSSTLKIHMRIHRGEKPYKCTHCSKAFIQSANLVAHLRVHTGEKPYQCHICEKRFSQSSSVKTHIRIHTGERPFPCEQCGKSFSDRSTLSKHRRVHQKRAMMN